MTRRTAAAAACLLALAGLAPAAETAARHPVPDEAAQEKARATIRNIFRDDYARTDPQARAALAKKLLQTGIGTTKDLPARYVLLREAADLAAQAADLSTALQAVKLLVASFDVDPLLTRGRTLATVAAATRSPDTLRQVVAAFLDLADSAASEGNAEVALRAVRAADRHARRVKDSDLLATAQAKARGLRALQDDLGRIPDARRSPDDPDAALLLARFHCLVKGDWEQGLALLARCPDRSLEALASLATVAQEPDALARIARAQLALADAAASADQFPKALQAVQAAGQTARKARDRALAAEVQDQEKSLRRLQAEHDKLAAARQTLADHPDDPQANLALGEYHLFVKADWEKGLPHLAKGADEGMKALATAELASPKTPAAQTELAERYRQLAEKQPDKHRKETLLRRAAHWYQQAIPQLTGLTKAKAEKTLGEVKDALADVQPGFAAVHGKVSREQIIAARRAGVPPIIEVPLGHGVTMRMVYIPPGQFMMGSPEGEGRPDEHPQHRVRITKGFYMGQTEVVGRYLDRDRTTVRTLRELREVVSEVADAMSRKDLRAFGELVSVVWELNKQIDPGSTNDEVDALLARVGPHVHGAKLLGAGGGGFLLMVCKSPEDAAAVRRMLEAEPPNARARFFDFNVSPEGLVVTVC